MRESVKRTLVLTATAAAAIIVSGCSSTNASKLSGPTLAESKVIVTTPDVVAGEKISGEANMTSILGGLIKTGDTKYADGVYYSTDLKAQEGGFFSDVSALFKSSDVEKSKAAAAYDACNKSGSDMILTPFYVVDQKDYVFFNKTHAEVFGYKGTIKGVKDVEYKNYKELTILNPSK